MVTRYLLARGRRIFIERRTIKRDENRRESMYERAVQVFFGGPRIL